MARGRRVEIVKIVVDGAEVDAKACTKCGEVKALHDYHLSKKAKDGHQSRCRACARVDMRKATEAKNPKARRFTRWTSDRFAKYVTKETNGEYTLIGNLTSVEKPIRMQHNACGREWMQRPSDFLQGKRCRPCSGFEKKTTEQFKQEVRVLVGNEYSVLSEYINSNALIVMRHNTCGNEWALVANSFLQDVRCPCCAGSKGERRVREFLDTRSYPYA
ncbi:hypothetical protein [Paenibacillus terrae]|uniref:hypothetical protein n=1 Tax=Paenibacillus terrae TaxID=159743 RepID=UPI0006992086|nr:hypothetical protein [Paenibacillus terrae]